MSAVTSRTKPLTARREEPHAIAKISIHRALKGRYIISPELRAEALARYVAGDRPKNIAIALGINDWNVSVIVRRAKVSRCKVAAQQLILSRGEWIGNRKYTVDDAAFSIVTPDSAYWCGFLIADGCVVGNKVRLKLAIKDVAHLEKFRFFLKTDAPITVSPPPDKPHRVMGRFVNSTASAFVTAASEQIVRDLNGFGVTPRKTYTAKVFNLDMNRDFWRGVIDGDGTIIISRDHPYIGLVGSEPLTTQFLAFCKTIVRTNVSVRPGKNIYKVLLSGTMAYGVIRELYGNAKTALDRKAGKAGVILSRWGHYHRP